MVAMNAAGMTVDAASMVGAASAGEDVTLWWGNTPAAWIWAAIGAVLGAALVHVSVHVVRRKLLPRAQSSPSSALRGLAAAASAVRLRLLVPISVVVAASFLDFPARFEWWLRLITFGLVAFQIALCVNRLIVTAIKHSAAPPPGRPAPVMLGIVTWTLQFVVWLTFLLALLTAGGVNITAFVASLGVGGIAVALALQNILGDLFASVSIGLDKPFEPGEFIAFDTDLGTVRHIGIKSTRITSLSGEELAIANSKLLEKLTHNYSRMNERRVAFGFAVPYAATREQLKDITERTSEAIRSRPSVRLDRGHFTGFDEAGFTFEFVYYVLDSDYTVYCDIQQDINHEIIGIVSDLGLTFAVPARRVAMDQS